jgi:hypothetical protein
VGKRAVREERVAVFVAAAEEAVAVEAPELLGALDRVFISLTPRRCHFIS